MRTSIPAPAFAGARPGYYFGTRDGILGYHALEPARAAPPKVDAGRRRPTHPATASRAGPSPPYYVALSLGAALLVLLVVVCLVGAS